MLRPHDLPLASEDTEAAPVNHPALVKTSDHPSFSSANFAPFTSAEALRATKSKTNRLASNALLGPSKRRKRAVCRDPSSSDAPSDSDTDVAVPFADDSMEGDEEQEADCVFCTGCFSEDYNVE